MNTKLKLTIVGRKNFHRLKTLKILTPFLNAAFEQRKKVQVIANLNTEDYELINYAFHWASSKEGHDFWEKKDHKLRRMINDETFL